ncbi:peptidoglycan editing factor PgeF [Tunturiibacter lichenicola]|uniref:peptidoglycan editing factor PgeF n=1 Tax=Tunturiibacter lichenicola TaxID=2051959 RepID=UPI003D9B072A
MGDEVAVVRVPGWQRFGWLRHGFSTRAGGVSTVYGEPSLNLGWTKDDEAALVAENRRRFVNAIGGEDRLKLVGLRQVHSDTVWMVGDGDGALQGRLETAEGKAVLEGDGLITDVAGVLIGVGTADCVPVLVVDGKKKVVAAFHAGWRGTAAGIVEVGIARMVNEYGSRVEDLEAAVGPSIGACCYAVGNEVHKAFGARFGYAEELFRVGDEEDSAKWYLDLWEANLRQLLHAGLKEEQITVIGECTACAQDESGAMKYFSHRGEMGVAGRMLSVVGVIPATTQAHAQ